MKKIGREVLFIAAKENNPRNGEGSFIRLRNGSILFGYTEYIGDDWEDDASARIVCITSCDEGESWTDKRVIIEKPVNAKNVMSLTFLRMNNDDIGAFYIHKNSDGTDKIMLIRSADEGITWSEPVDCMQSLDRQDYYVMNNDRALRTASGRIILPMARHSIYINPEFAPGVLCFFVSDDDGKSWRKTETEFSLPYDTDDDGYQEPGLYQFTDGRLWCYIRTALGCQFECFSDNDGESWTSPEPNHFFTSPLSPMLVKDVGEITVAIFNPIANHLLSNDELTWGRTPYVCSVSYDKGRTFTKENTFYIEDDMNNGYCYPAVISCKDGFLIAYYHSNNSGICLNSTKIIKIMYNEITGDNR